VSTDDRQWTAAPELVVSESPVESGLSHRFVTWLCNKG